MNLKSDLHPLLTSLECGGHSVPLHLGFLACTTQVGSVLAGGCQERRGAGLRGGGQRLSAIWPDGRMAGALVACAPSPRTCPAGNRESSAVLAENGWTSPLSSESPGWSYSDFCGLCGSDLMARLQRVLECLTSEHLGWVVCKSSLSVDNSRSQACTFHTYTCTYMCVHIYFCLCALLF